MCSVILEKVVLSRWCFVLVDWKREGEAETSEVMTWRTR